MPGNVGRVNSSRARKVICIGKTADEFGPVDGSIDIEAKASSNFSPDPQEAQNFIYLDTMVSKYVSCTFASESLVSPLEGRP